MRILFVLAIAALSAMQWAPSVMARTETLYKCTGKDKDGKLVGVYTNTPKERCLKDITVVATMTTPEIGMKQKDVPGSTWGEPLKTQKVTTAKGVGEEWTYPEGRYLHFENGVLTEIGE